MERFEIKENEILSKNPNISKLLYSTLADHQDVCSSEDCKVGKTFWDTFKTELVPHAQPVHQRIRPLAPPLKENLKLQLEQWLKDEVIEPSNSPWSSLLVPVTKRNNTVR